jgi:hypothetical protein
VAKVVEEAVTKTIAEEAMAAKAAAEAAAVAVPDVSDNDSPRVVHTYARGLLTQRWTRRQWVRGAWRCATHFLLIFFFFSSHSLHMLSDPSCML